MPDGGGTFVAENGTGVRLEIAVLPVLSAGAWVTLWLKHSRGTRLAEPVAGACIAGVMAFCVLGMLTIGVFVLPAPLFLAWGAALTPSGAPG